MLRSLILILAALIAACSNQPAQQNEELPKAMPSLDEVWASDTLLRTPESVLYDRSRNVIYVANVNLNPWEKDGNGFISRLDAHGKIIDLKWITNLSGPKGMGILNQSLFVADIDELVEIDMGSSQVINRYLIAGTPTLNDVTIFDGVVYISGSDSNRIFELREGKINMILEGDLGRPNGLFAEPERLLMITSNSSQLVAIDLASMQTEVLVDSLGHGDGIVPVGNGDYLASSWRGEIFHIDSDWNRTQLLDTRSGEINAADIDFIIEQNLLLVPTFFDNRVVAYRLVN
ncbi:MAG: hypothetical protein OEQ53_12065 [Saprospiraceae bacterium]|nr:hypothetical protein [Saprospiraceae bacterium]